MLAWKDSTWYNRTMLHVMANFFKQENFYTAFDHLQDDEIKILVTTTQSDGLSCIGVAAWANNVNFLVALLETAPNQVTLHKHIIF